jgi:hypothetical protein
MFSTSGLWFIEPSCAKPLSGARGSPISEDVAASADAVALSNPTAMLATANDFQDILFITHSELKNHRALQGAAWPVMDNNPR